MRQWIVSLAVAIGIAGGGLFMAPATVLAGSIAPPPTTGAPVPTIGGATITKADCSMVVTVTGTSAATATATASVPPAGTCAVQGVPAGTGCTINLVNETAIAGSGPSNDFLSSNSACSNSNVDALAEVYSIEYGLVLPVSPTQPKPSTTGGTSGITATSCNLPFPISLASSAICPEIIAVNLIGNPGQLIEVVVSWLISLMALPLTLTTLLSGAIFRGSGADLLQRFYDYFEVPGLFVLGAGSAFRYLSLIRRSHDKSPMFPFVDQSIRTLVGVVLISVGWSGISFLVHESYSLAAALNTDLSQIGGQQASADVGSHVFQMVGLALSFGANSAWAAIASLVLAVMLIYLFFVMLAALCMLMMCAALAPIFIGTSVFSISNQYSKWFISIFTGALLTPIVATAGICITASMMAVVGTSSATAGGLMLIFGAGGCYATGRLIQGCLKGVFQHGSIGGLMGAVGGVVMAGVGVGGALATGGLSLGATALAGHALGAPGLAGAVSGIGSATAANAAAAAAPSGIHAMASPAIGKVLAQSTTPSQTFRHMLADPQTSKLINAATKHMSEDTSAGERLAEMQGNKVYDPLLTSMMHNGTYAASVVRGGSEPPSFGYNSSEMEHMMDQATRLSDALGGGRA